MFDFVWQAVQQVAESAIKSLIVAAALVFIGTIWAYFFPDSVFALDLMLLAVAITILTFICLLLVMLADEY